ncbi:MAG TPA: hypothetical protein VK708_06875 [Bryobacteraceae bacterium]|nr:hypothetical protein [Bryobacteraceae bacterium]
MFSKKWNVVSEFSELHAIADLDALSIHASGDAAAFFQLDDR